MLHILEENFKGFQVYQKQLFMEKWTPAVEVHFRIAHVSETPGGPEKVGRAPRHQLRHDGEARIDRRSELAQLSIGKARLDRGRHERKVVAVGCAEDLRVQTAKDARGEPLHRGDGELRQGRGGRHEEALMMK